MATEYKLPYTALDINRRLGKVDEIDSLKDLVGAEPVQKQISDAVKNIGEAIKTDTTLKVRGKAADAKAVGDAIANSKVEIDKTLKVSGKAADAKVTGDEITKLNTLVGNTPVADQITTAVEELAGNVYTHPDTHPASMITGLSSVAISGDYNDLNNLPETPEQYIHPESHPASMITGLADVATSGSYEDLSNKPAIPEEYTHPDTHPVDMITGLSTVAVSGDYEDLANKPTIPDEYVHPSSHSVNMITGLADIATSGDYNDLVNKPTIPNEYTHPENHPASMITGLSDVATSGSYNDLTDKPTIPSIEGLATLAYVDEKFANVGVGGGSGTSTGLPEFTTEDEGKVLSIKDGAPSWESVEGSSIESNTAISWNDISDKPFDEESGTVTFIDGSYKYVYDESNQGWDMEAPIPNETGVNLAIGNTCTVTWNGEMYECEVIDASMMIPGAVMVGNIDLVMGSGNNGMPFVIVSGDIFGDGSNVFGYMLLGDPDPTVTTEVMISIKLEVNIVQIKQLDEKFIPLLYDKITTNTFVSDAQQFGWDSYFGCYAMYLDTFSVDDAETMWNEFTSATVNWSEDINVLTTYKVTPQTITFNGVSYRAVGNLVNFGGTGNSEPFIIVAGNLFGDGMFRCALLNLAYSSEIEIAPDVIYNIILTKDEGKKIKPEYLDFMNNSGSNSTPLPEVTTSDAGKFLRVGADGNWIVEALQDVSEVGL